MCKLDTKVCCTISRTSSTDDASPMSIGTRMNQMDHVNTKPSVSNIQNVKHRLPWYASGGMTVNLLGIVCNIIFPLYTISRSDTIIQTHFIWLLLSCYAIATCTTVDKTTYCIFVVPTYMASLYLLPLIVEHNNHHDAGSNNSMIEACTILIISAIIASMKINVCMSVCMHRYASHAAFKCNSTMNVFLCILSCLANQGGPLWWSSQHRCHHKFCESKRDPHSPSQVGIERAFGFFLEQYHVEEEFVPRHINFKGLRILDTWSFLVVSIELWIAYTYFGGNVGLFIAFTSGWMSQTISLWFNVANHPIDDHIVSVETNITDVSSIPCTASDHKADLGTTKYMPFYLLDSLVPIFSWLAMEDAHEHHHTHSKLAKRSEYDVAYWTFIKPLEMLGLISNVVVK